MIWVLLVGVASVLELVFKKLEPMIQLLCLIIVRGSGDHRISTFGNLCMVCVPNVKKKCRVFNYAETHCIIIMLLC